MFYRGIAIYLLSFSLRNSLRILGWNLVGSASSIHDVMNRPNKKQLVLGFPFAGLHSFPSCPCFCMEVLVEFIKTISVYDFGWKEISKSKVRRPVHLHFRELHNAHVNSQPKETLLGQVLFHAILNLAWWLPSVERSGSSLWLGS